MRQGALFSANNDGVCQAAEGDAHFSGFGEVAGVCLPEVVEQLVHDDAVFGREVPRRAYR